MDEVGSAQFDHERRNDIGQEDDSFGYVGADEV